MLVYALRKFTGGLGDEDDVEREDKNAWRKYFIKDYTDTRHVVSLEKANGEAAHMSCRWLNGAFVVCAGSKNVHLVFKTESTIFTIFFYSLCNLIGLVFQLRAKPNY